MTRESNDQRSVLEGAAKNGDDRALYKLSLNYYASAKITRTVFESFVDGKLFEKSKVYYPRETHGDGLHDMYQAITDDRQSLVIFGALCNTIEDEVLEYEDASVPVYGETALGRIISITQSMDVQSFCCGGEHAAILTTSGSIFTWGKSSFGRLGHGAPTLQRQNNHPGHVGRPKNER